MSKKLQPFCVIGIYLDDGQQMCADEIKARDSRDAIIRGRKYREKMEGGGDYTVICAFPGSIHPDTTWGDSV